MLDSTGIYGDTYRFMSRTQVRNIPPLPENFEQEFNKNVRAQVMEHNLYFRHFSSRWISEMRAPGNKEHVLCPNCYTVKSGSICSKCGFNYDVFRSEVAKYNQLVDQAGAALQRSGRMTYDEWNEARYREYRWNESKGSGTKEDKFSKYFPEIDMKATLEILADRNRNIYVANIGPSNLGMSEGVFKQELEESKEASKNYSKGLTHNFYENFQWNIVWMIPAGLFSLFINGGIALIIVMILYFIYGMNKRKRILTAKHLEFVLSDEFWKRYRK